MVFDDQHPVVFHTVRLNNQLEAKRHKLKELESEWDSVKNPLQEKMRNLEQALLSLRPEASGKHMRMKEIDLETESISAEIKKRWRISGRELPNSIDKDYRLKSNKEEIDGSQLKNYSCGVKFTETEQGVAQAIIPLKAEFKRDPWPKISDKAKDLVKKLLNP